jgi:hypothetical protein
MTQFFFPDSTIVFKTVFARGSSKKGEIRTFAQFAIALGKPMKKE